MTQVKYNRPHTTEVETTEVEVSVEWIDGDETRQHVVGVAIPGDDAALRLAAQAGAVAYATASEGGMPARVCVRGFGVKNGTVIYRTW